MKIPELKSWLVRIVFLGLLPLTLSSTALGEGDEFVSQTGEAVALDLAVDQVPIADPALAACIKAYSAEQGYQSVAQVHEIPCFNRRIRSLAGIESFSGALVIDVSMNEISDFSPLYHLGARLGYLDIHGNQVGCSLLMLLPRLLPRAAIVGLDPRDCKQEGSSPLPPSLPPLPSPPPPPLPPAHPAEPNAPHPPSNPDADYVQVSAVVSRHCGGCHTGGGHKDGVYLDTEQDLASFARASLSMVASGRMPPRDYDFAQSPDGQLLMSYLKAHSNQRGGEPSRPGCRHRHRGGEGREDDFLECDDD